ncbi:MAG: hypothetical protein CVU46_18135 [Chloroflexi bacterium HGW-Chloroflexi-8]|jgi:hypothetical protein|nr:MAG: hypothetical protein CVU46_18135 [Chloroflexi bacterium HGW-Chloroflexi-8]
MAEFDKYFQHRQIGLHYFPDSLHFRNEDIKKWIPELKRLKVSWLILKSEIDRAIPEAFLESLMHENITPIIEFNLPINQSINTRELKILFQVYARWGIQYVILFDRPNQKANWLASTWVQNDLIDRFLDKYIPIARLAIEENLTPVFPPLEPGGSYWDTAFLRGSLTILKRRNQEEIIKNMVLSAYAHTGGKDLNWGAGGPERWPQTRPYITPENSQDQLGFRIYEWYQAIAKAVFQKEFPMILLQAGLNSFPDKSSAKIDQRNNPWAAQTEIIKLLKDQQGTNSLENSPYEPIPSNILCCNFYQLAGEVGTKENNYSWYQDGLPQCSCINSLIGEQESPSGVHTVAKSKTFLSDERHPIRHYVLLPVYESGVSDWHLHVVQPFVKKHQATVGFSLNEAILAANVTVVASSKSITDECLNDLRKAGCSVERISGDGTSIATQLSER